MKFGKQLESEAEDIPSEWRPYLIQYKALKKLVTKVAEEIESRGLSASLLHECLEDSSENEHSQHPREEIPRIRYYFRGEPPNVKPNIEFTYDTKNPQVQKMVSCLLSTNKNDMLEKPKLEFKRSQNNKDFFGLILNKEQEAVEASDVKRQRRDSTVVLVKELLSLTLEKKQHPEQEDEDEERNLKTLVIELEQDDEFFKMLMEEIQQAAQLNDINSKKITNTISDLETRIVKVASPSHKSEMYTWRKIFSIYMDAHIFQGSNTTSIEKAKKQMTWFVEQLHNKDILKKIKSRESKIAFERFVNLNNELVTMKHYQLLNQTAMRKILKKHDKRSGLTASQSFPGFISTEWLINPKLINMLYSVITTKLITIIPQPEDYACPICMNVAWRPIRLACSHLFCVRCLIKAQKKKMDSCPLCRHPTAVRIATALNLDEGLQNFLKLYFPQEIKQKKLENDREQAIEDVQAMTGKRYTEEQLLRMNQQMSDNKCFIM
ncbi:SPX domain-containing protein [Cokeromyces recurvatus]|uniref:SPX domain-containing protein n=1 Tax=Cokeromyces recurvatus TaxID=90255 RepID=UPI00222036BC|nr:SPX domain-containing protein [Cokeromyces recurvatus]KAI7906620.1 SPX domain-containing protein [Cokeromyces recurvatus]